MMQKVEGFSTETEACGGRAKVNGREPTNDTESAGFRTETEACGGRAKVNGREPTNYTESERF